MAPPIEMTQSELSRYVRVFGGSLKIVAEVGKKKVVLA
jgi:hypothetical protein